MYLSIYLVLCCVFVAVSGVSTAAVHSLPTVVVSLVAEHSL